MPSAGTSAIFFGIYISQPELVLSHRFSAASLRPTVVRRSRQQVIGKMDQQVLQCLQATLSLQEDVRRTAEQQLRELFLHPGQSSPSPHAIEQVEMIFRGRAKSSSDSGVSRCSSIATADEFYG